MDLLLDLNKIWLNKAYDCHFKKKQIAEIIEDIDFQNFNFKQLSLIKKRLDKFYKNYPKLSETSDPYTDLWWVVYKLYFNGNGHWWLYSEIPTTLRQLWKQLKSIQNGHN